MSSSSISIDIEEGVVRHQGRYRPISRKWSCDIELDIDRYRSSGRASSSSISSNINRVVVRYQARYRPISTEWSCDIELDIVRYQRSIALALNPVSRGGRGAAERRKADSFALTGLFPRPATKETAFLYSASPHSASPRPPRETVFFTALSAQHSEAGECPAILARSPPRRV